MARYKVFIKPSAAKEIEAVDNVKDRLRIVRRIRRLALEPRPPGCEKLSGEDKYRLRQGEFRIVYAIEDENLIVYVVKVGHRREVYR
ncbi:MAG TPA: type II toxin-antitoxin system RelE/ParE family toxin [Vicinamibacteria bacterium]|nr:type II toxin-antitoxin system RelE/ParE family toxin [Vicinamibacteria bacterium]